MSSRPCAASCAVLVLTLGYPARGLGQAAVSLRAPAVRALAPVAPLRPVDGLAALPVAASVAAPAPSALRQAGQAVAALTQASPAEAAPVLAQAFDNGVASPEAADDPWPVLERLLQEQLGMALMPGDADRWARRTGELLREDVTAPLEAAAARAAAEVYGLDAGQAAAVEEFLSRRAQAVMRREGVDAIRFYRLGDDVYVRAMDGLYLRRGNAWETVLAGNLGENLVLEAAGRLYAYSDKKAFEIEDGRVRQIGSGTTSAQPRPVEFAGAVYAGLDGGRLYRRSASGDWSPVYGVPGEVRGMEIFRGELAVATGDGQYLISPDGQARPWPLSIRGARYLYSHGGRLFVRGYDARSSREVSRMIDLQGAERRVALPRYGIHNIRGMGRLYKVEKDRLFIGGSGRWTSVEGIQGRVVAGHYQWTDRELFVDTAHGFYVVEGRRARRVGGGIGMLFGAIEARGRRLVIAQSGIYEILGDRLRLVYAARQRKVSGALIEHDGLLYAGTDAGLQDILMDDDIGFPERWAEALLRGVSADISRRVSAAEKSRPYQFDDEGRILDEEGRVIFGLARKRQ